MLDQGLMSWAALAVSTIALSLVVSTIALSLALAVPTIAAVMVFEFEQLGSSARGVYIRTSE